VGSEAVLKSPQPTQFWLSHPEMTTEICDSWIICLHIHARLRCSAQRRFRNETSTCVPTICSLPFATASVDGSGEFRNVKNGRWNSSTNLSNSYGNVSHVVHDCKLMPISYWYSHSYGRFERNVLPQCITKGVSLVAVYRLYKRQQVVRIWSMNITMAGSGQYYSNIQICQQGSVMDQILRSYLRNVGSDMKHKIVAKTADLHQSATCIGHSRKIEALI
jgi:hypothetical protein